MIRIEVYRKRKQDVSFIEDIYSQAEIGAMTPIEILEYAKAHNNKICCCYSKILNIIGKYIRTQDLKVDDFHIYIVEEKNITTYNNKGQIKDWIYGYMG